MIPAEPNLHMMQLTTGRFSPDSREINVYRVVAWMPTNECGFNQPLIVRVMWLSWHGTAFNHRDTWTFGAYQEHAHEGVETSDLDQGSETSGTLYFTPEGNSMRHLIDAVNERLPYMGAGEILPVPLAGMKN